MVVSRPLLQIAPMLDVTYPDFRFFMRLLTKRAQLWTEMVVESTILHNLEPEKCDKFLGYHESEHPVVCQLGGSEPDKLAEAARVVERYGYDEVNLNVGCPSNKVAQKGEFGCSLMLRKEVVRDIIHAMTRAVQIPVTVKCRLGADDHDSPEFTRSFVETVAQGGCKHFQVHARKAWLKGLSPAANRSIPPLHYPRVIELCQRFPDLSFSLNGGVNSVSHARALLGFPGGALDGETPDLVAQAWDWCSAKHGAFPGVPSNFAGVMIGRGCASSPMMLWDVDHTLYGEEAPALPPTRRSVVAAYKTYLDDKYPADGEASVQVMHRATKPALGLFAGLRGNKAFRGQMDRLIRDKEMRLLGPGAALEAAVELLEESNRGLLDEPLQRTSAHKPTLGAGGQGNHGDGDGGERLVKKRKVADVGDEIAATKRRTDKEVEPTDGAHADKSSVPGSLVSVATVETDSLCGTRDVTGTGGDRKSVV